MNWSLFMEPDALPMLTCSGKKSRGLLTEVMLKVSPLVHTLYFHICTGQGTKPELQ